MLRDKHQTTPVEDVLASSGETPTPVITKLRLLREIGWPQARASLHNNRGDRIIVRSGKDDPAIWELKMSPHCWRLYFHVYEKSQNFAFVHAVCKKATTEDPADAVAARNVFNDLQAGLCDLTHLPLEAG
jgi:hypothetical protein